MQSSRESRSRRKQLVERISEIGFVFQNLSLNSRIAIILYFTVQRVSTAILIIWGLLPQPILLQINIRELLLQQWQENSSLLLHVTTLIWCLQLGLCLLLVPKGHLAMKYILGEFIIFAMVCPLLLIEVSVSFLHEMRSGARIVGCLNVVAIVMLGLVYQLVSLSFSLVRENWLCHRFMPTYAFSMVFQQICCICFPFILRSSWELEDQNVAVIIFYVFFLARCVSCLYNEIYGLIYLNTFTSSLHILALCFEISVSACASFSIVLKEDLIYQNFWFLTLSFFLFSSTTIRRYVSHRNQQFQFIDEEDLETPQQVFLYFRIIYQIFENLKVAGENESSFIIRNKKKKHQSTCQDPGCDCHQSIVPYSFYCLLYIGALNEALKKFDKNDDLTLFITEFKLEVFNVYADSFWAMKRINKSRMSLCLQISIQRIWLKLEEFFVKKNFFLKIVDTQKVYESDLIITDILMDFSRLIALKNEFWTFLYKEIIDEGFLYSNINSQLGIQRKFYSRKTVILEGYGSNEMLLNLLVFYEKVILLKGQLSKEILDQVENIKNKNKRIIFNKLGKNQNVEVEKYMFSDKCCTIETKVDEERMGTIVHASKNVQRIFGYKPRMIESSNINRIMPHSMREEHDRILQNWVLTGHWTNIGVLRHIFAFNKTKNCFSISIYLKILLKEDSISILGTVFQDNDKDFMLINEQGVIDGAGSKFISLLGHKIVGLPLHLISDCCLTEGKKVKHKPQIETKTFHSVKNHSENIEGYLLEKYKISNSEEALREKKNELLQCLNKESESFEIEYEVIPYSMGSKRFMVIKFLRFCEKKGISTLSEGFIKNETTKSLTSFFEDGEDFSVVNENGDEEDKFLACDTSSMGKSIRNESFSADSIIRELENKFLNTQMVKEKRGFIVSLAMFFLCLIVLTITITKISFTSTGLTEVQQLFFADGACSDNMQLLEFMYNKMMNMKLYENSSEFSSVMQSANFEREYVLSLISAEFLNYESFVTSLTRQNYYIYQLNEVEWVTFENDRVKVTSTQFMSNLIGIAKSMYNIFSGNKYIQDRSEVVRLDQRLFYWNFPQMKQINHENLAYYLDLFRVTIRNIEAFLIVKLCLTILCVFLFLVVYCLQVKFREKEQGEIWKQFGLIYKENCGMIKNFYGRIEEIFQKNKNNQTPEQDKKGAVSCQTMKDEEIHLKISLCAVEMEQIEVEETLKSISKFKVIQTSDRIWPSLFWILSLVVAILSLNGVAFMSDKGVLKVSERMMVNINDLMDSENFILEAYFDLKAESIINNRQKDRESLAKQLLRNMNQSEVVFNRVALDSIEIFSKYDSSYEGDMIQLITHSLCQLEKEVLPDWLFRKCQQSLSLNLTSKGLMKSMNFFQRTVLESIYSSKQIQLSAQFFRGIKFLNIDYSIFIMFKMYQGTQSRVYESLKKTIEDHESDMLYLTGIEMAIYLCMSVFAVWRYFRERKRSSDVNGILALIPARLIKVGKKMMKDFTQIGGLETDFKS